MRPSILILLAEGCAGLIVPRIVFADCDGTMLNPDHRLTARTRETLQRLQCANVLLVPATGRGRAGAWTEHVLSEPALRNGVPGIYINGAFAVDSDGVVASSTLSSEVVEEVIMFSAASPGTTTVVYTADEALVSVDNSLTAMVSAAVPSHSACAHEA